MPITQKISEENIALARQLYQEKITTKEIMKRCHMKWPTIYKYVKDLPKHGNQKHTIDHSFLDNIDTKEKAYFIGFFLADGYFNPKLSRIQFGLKDSDAEVLHTFKKWFSTSYPVWFYSTESSYGKNNEVRLYLLSSRFSSQLQALGIPLNKTWDLETFPKVILDNEYLFRYALKGFIDGDGWISKGKSSVHIIGTTNMMKCIDRYTQKYYGIKWTFCPENRTSKPMMNIKICGEQSRRLEQILYKDNIGLKRKAVIK